MSCSFFFFVFSYPSDIAASTLFLFVMFQCFIHSHCCPSIPAFKGGSLYLGLQLTQAGESVKINVIRFLVACTVDWSVGLSHFTFFELIDVGHKIGDFLSRAPRPLSHSVGRSVRLSVTLCFFWIFGHFKGRKDCIWTCPCPNHYCPFPTTRDSSRVYGLVSTIFVKGHRIFLPGTKNLRS